MTHESNHWANIGGKNPNASYDQFKAGGASDSQAAEATAAAARARAASGKS